MATLTIASTEVLDAEFGLPDCAVHVAERIIRGRGLENGDEMGARLRQDRQRMVEDASYDRGNQLPGGQRRMPRRRREGADDGRDFVSLGHGHSLAWVRGR